MKKVKIAQIGTEHDHAAQNFNSILKQAAVFDILGYARLEDEAGYNFKKWNDIQETKRRMV